MQRSESTEHIGESDESIKHNELDQYRKNKTWNTNEKTWYSPSLNKCQEKQSFNSPGNITLSKTFSMSRENYDDDDDDSLICTMTAIMIMSVREGG